MQKPSNFYSTVISQNIFGLQLYNDKKVEEITQAQKNKIAPSENI